MSGRAGNGTKEGEKLGTARGTGKAPLLPHARAVAPGPGRAQQGPGDTEQGQKSFPSSSRAAAAWGWLGRMRREGRMMRGAIAALPGEAQPPPQGFVPPNPRSPSPERGAQPPAAERRQSRPRAGQEARAGPAPAPESRRDRDPGTEPAGLGYSLRGLGREECPAPRAPPGPAGFGTRLTFPGPAFPSPRCRLPGLPHISRGSGALGTAGTSRPGYEVTVVRGPCTPWGPIPLFMDIFFPSVSP